MSRGQTAPASAANAGELFAPYKTERKEVGVKVDLGVFVHTFSLYQITRPTSYIDISADGSLSVPGRRTAADLVGQRQQSEQSEQ